jgi:hypothetical protein
VLTNPLSRRPATALQWVESQTKAITSPMARRIIAMKSEATSANGVEPTKLPTTMNTTATTVSNHPASLRGCIFLFCSRDAIAFFL